MLYRQFRLNLIQSYIFFTKTNGAFSFDSINDMSQLGFLFWLGELLEEEVNSFKKFLKVKIVVLLR